MSNRNNGKKEMIQVQAWMEEKSMRDKMMRMYYRFQVARIRLWNSLAERASGYRELADPGIDGILVTVGLCIIALLLCVVMKNSLTEFIHSIVSSMTKEASDILKGTRV